MVMVMNSVYLYVMICKCEVNYMKGMVVGFGVGDKEREEQGNSGNGFLRVSAGF